MFTRAAAVEGTALADKLAAQAPDITPHAGGFEQEVTLMLQRSKH
jgi:hypothetical protein